MLFDRLRIPYFQPITRNVSILHCENTVDTLSSCRQEVQFRVFQCSETWARISIWAAALICLWFINNHARTAVQFFILLVTKSRQCFLALQKLKSKSEWRVMICCREKPRCWKELIGFSRDDKWTIKSHFQFKSQLRISGYALLQTAPRKPGGIISSLVDQAQTIIWFASVPMVGYTATCVTVHGKYFCFTEENWQYWKTSIVERWADQDNTLNPFPFWFSHLHVLICVYSCS